MYDNIVVNEDASMVTLTCNDGNILVVRLENYIGNEIRNYASNMNHIKTAIDGKANAVYGGLKKWNARNKAINFTTEEYNFLIKELHKKFCDEFLKNI